MGEGCGIVLEEGAVCALSKASPPGFWEVAFSYQTAVDFVLVALSVSAAAIIGWRTAKAANDDGRYLTARDDVASWLHRVEESLRTISDSRSSRKRGTVAVDVARDLGREMHEKMSTAKFGGLLPETIAAATALFLSLEELCYPLTEARVHTLRTLCSKMREGYDVELRRR